MRQKQMSNNEDVSTFVPLVMLSDLAVSNINLLSNLALQALTVPYIHGLYFTHGTEAS